MAFRQITYVDSPRGNVDKDVAAMGGWIFLGKMADGVLDVVDDLEFGDTQATQQPVVAAALQQYNALAKQVVHPLDFFAYSAMPVSTSWFLDPSDEGDSDPVSPTAEQRKILAARFRDVATALDHLSRAEQTEPELDLIREEFARMSLLAHKYMHLRADRSVRHTPWSAS